MTPSNPPRGFIFHPVGDNSCVAALALTECGTVYASCTEHVIPGEVLSKEVNHTKSEKSFLKGTAADAKSVLNYEVLDIVHPNTVRAALRRLGSTLPLRRNCIWLKVHGD